METRVKLLGHPIHPMLVVLPLGLLSVGVAFDVVYLVTGDPLFAEVAFWNITVGIVGGLLAALFGLVDWLAIPTGTRARSVGLWHGLGNLVLVLVFIVSWLLRLGNHAYAPDILPFVLGLLGVGLALATAWLGGELVFRLRVGVDDGAQLDAPSSLTGGAATQTVDRGGSAGAAG
ncbi:MAG TPA: DUF2231 domain-containing protein [Candidatus Limnocylindrales bacterium]|nr:DUF2231 domain-containing protein [Candidatus Limnocylindrales bacterium]